MKKLTGIFAAAMLCLAITSAGLASIMWTSTNFGPGMSLRYQDPVSMKGVLRNFTGLTGFMELHRDDLGNLYASFKVANSSDMTVKAYGLGAGVPMGGGKMSYQLCWQGNLPEPEIVLDGNTVLTPESIYMVGSYSYNAENKASWRGKIYIAGILDLYNGLTPAELTVKFGTRDPAAPGFSPYTSIDRTFTPSATVNVNPTATDKSVSIDFGTADVDVDLVEGAYSFQDSPLLTAQIVGHPPNGSLSAPDNGQVTYTPTIDFEGNDTFTFRVVDSELLKSDVHKVTVTVTGKPKAGCLVQKVKRDSTDNVLDFSPLGLVPGVTWVESVSSSEYGTTTEGASDFTFNPAAGFTGHQLLNYSITGASGWTDSGVIDVQVCPVAEPDVATVTKLVDATVVINVLDNDIDFSGSTTNLTVTEALSGAHGTVTITDTGTTLTYTVTDTAASVDHVYYVVRDADGNTGVGSVTVLLQ